VALVHALAPPAGLVEVKTSPALAVATHSETDGHDTASTIPSPEATGALLQELAPPLGSVAVSTSLPPTATHNEIDGQETPPIDSFDNTPAMLHAVGPRVGLGELRMLPARSPATHRETDGQDTALSGWDIGLVVARQAANPLESSAKKSSP